MTDRDRALAALHGLIEQLPVDGWSSDRRNDWLEALVLVLDLTVPTDEHKP